MEGVTIDTRTANFTAGANGGLNLNGTGTFDVTLNNCKILNLAGARAFGTANTPSATRITITNSRLLGGTRGAWTGAPLYNFLATQPPLGTDTAHTAYAWRQSNTSLAATGTFCELFLTNVDCRGGFTTYNSVSEAGKVVVNGSLFGADQLSSNGTDSNVWVNGNGFNYGGAFRGTTLSFTNCIADGCTDTGVAGFGSDATVQYTGCQFRNCASQGVYANSSGTPVTSGFSAITDCTFDTNPGRNPIFLGSGIDQRITNTTVTGFRGAGVNYNAVGTNATTLTVVGCSFDTGTTNGTTNGRIGNDVDATKLLGATDPASMIIGQAGIILIVDRSTFTGRHVTGGPILATAVNNGTAISIATAKKFSLTNSVLEGNDIAIKFTTTGTSTTNATIYNNTIVPTADAKTSWTLLMTPTAAGFGNTRASNPSFKNNIILNRPFLTNKYTTVTLANSNNIITTVTTPATDPKFVRPNTYVVPATSGLSNYHLTPGSANAIDKGIALPSITVDRDNHLRDATPDLGAYELFVLPNPARNWWQF